MSSKFETGWYGCLFRESHPARALRHLGPGLWASGASDFFGAKMGPPPLFPVSRITPTEELAGLSKAQKTGGSFFPLG